MPHGYVSGSEFPPDDAMRLGHQTDGAGHLYLAVASTEWGRIPGKAKEGTCWYSYDGTEYDTDDFEWVTFPNTIITVPNTGDGPPPHARPIGYQNDGRGEIYGAIANTEWGRIPGKAQDNTCWFPYGGQEHDTDDFDWLASSRIESSYDVDSMDIDFVRRDEPPGNALNFGYQNDGAGTLYVAVAETEWGRIPGKAKDGTCWYSYDGVEYDTDDFHWVVYTSPHKLIHNDECGCPPENAAVTGEQNDGRGDQYSVIAITDWGRIPGKAVEDTCWFPYDGEEHETGDFEWVVIDC